MAFNILAVCTGNVCRSPQAEQLLRAELAHEWRPPRSWEVPSVSSAGIYALVGEAMPDTAAQLSRQYGGNPDGHRSRQLTPQLVEDADLILAMAKEHRGAVSRLVSRASRKTFTLREFARTLDTAWQMTKGLDRPDPGDFQGWLSAAVSHRGFSPTLGEDDDVLDPFGRDEASYMASVEQIAPAVHRIVMRLTGSV